MPEEGFLLLLIPSKHQSRPLSLPHPAWNPKKKQPHCNCKAVHQLGHDLWTDSSSQKQHQPFLPSSDAAGVIQTTCPQHTAAASVAPLPEVQHSNTSREGQRERAFSRYNLLSGLRLFLFPARVYECMRSCMLSSHAACAPGMSPSRAGDPAASWGNPFAMGVSLQFMTKQEQPQSPCATKASPASEQQAGDCRGQAGPSYGCV